MDDIRIGEYLIPESELEESFDTSGGPGGQHANRNETTVRLRFHIPSSSLPESIRNRLIDRYGETIEVKATQSRSQFRNRALARQQLKKRLEEGLEMPARRRKTRPSGGSKRKRVAKKRARGETKRLRQNPPVDD
jgi:ribosome-associated protein